MNTTVATFRLFVTAFCLFCINLVALADETSLPTNWDDYGKLATFTNGERIDEDIVLSTVEGRPTYTIYTARGLAWVACVVNNFYDNNHTPFNKDEGYYPSINNFKYCNIELANDISLAKPSEGVSDNFDACWIPVGDYNTYMAGNFDGKGYTISNLKVLRTLGQGAKTAGLIGYARCSIENELLSIKNLNVTGSSVEGPEMVGGIVGYGVNVQISCCSSQIEMISINYTPGTEIGYTFLGGIAGSLVNSEIKNCWSSGKLYCEPLSYGGSYGGGIVGNASESTISDSYSTATVTATGAGGIAGNLGANTTIKNCLALNTDGIMGYSDRGRIWARDNSESPVTAADNYASILVKLYKVTDDEMEEKNIYESEAYDGKKCTYKKLEALFGSNENFTFDGTYLPQLKEVSGQTQLAVNTYLGSNSITNSVGEKIIVQKAEIPGEEVEIIDNPNDWYKVTEVTITGADLTSDYGRFTFTMPDNEVTVSGCSIIVMNTWEKYGDFAEKDTDYAISADGKTYTIKTARGMAWVACATNNGMTGGDYPASAGFEGCTVELGNDISLAQPTGFPVGFASWTPIGTSANPFLGTFDGKYKAISGLTVTNAESAGLFGYVGNSASDKKGKICNVGINEANITYSLYAGALVGRLYGTMERCWSSGSVTAASSGTQTAEAAGGLVGEATGGSIISNCYSTATVTAPLAGGVVGSINGTFSYCYATGAVTSNGTASSGSGAAGGICGKLITSADAEIKRNFALNKDGIAAQENGDVGRIIGNVSAGGSITYTDNYASVLIDGVWSETDINGKACTFDKLNLLCQDNAFMCDNTYLPKLVDGSSNVMSGQEDLKILDYIGGGSITVTSSGNSNISATKESAICGETVEFTVTPESEWYYIVSVKVNKVNDDGSLGDEVSLSQPSGKYSFTMPETPVKITVNIDAIDTWEEYAMGAVKGTDYNKDGTTYTINTARGLAWVAYVTNIKKTSSDGDVYPGSAGFREHTINLANDISITKPEGAPGDWASWTPIGTSEKPFLGTFDGNNHVVSNLTVSDFESAGLFGCVGNSTVSKQGKICNLGVDGSNVKGTTNVGAIAGQLYGTMEKCWSSGSVTATSDSGNGGGLVGQATDGSTISNCYSTATVTAYNAGGVVGNLEGSLAYCYATEKVTSISASAGGICGTVIDGANINNCIALNADGITGSATGRIWGQGSVTGSSNYASTKINGTWTSDATGKDGEDVKYSGYISYVKGNWQSDVWTINNKNLPQLNGMSGQPTLPRETYMEVDVAYITITPPSCGRIEVYEEGVKLVPDSENKIEVANGSTVTIKAIADSGYGFSWMKIAGVQQQGATVENYEVNDDITITASFYYIIPSVFMYDDVCYEKRWDANYWEEVTVRDLSSFYYNKYYSGDLEIPEKVPFYGTNYKVTAINDRAFRKSSELKSVVLPSVVNKIGSYAFEGCTGLEKLVVKSPSAVTQAATTEPVVPTVGEHAFDDICETAVLYVPENWKDAFKAAPEWSKFFTVKEQSEDGTVLAELTMTSTDGGSLSVDETTAENDTKTVKVAEGTDVTVTVTPHEGYMLISLNYDGVDVTDQLVDGKLTLSGISGEKCISAVFGVDTSIGGAGASSQNVYVKNGRIVVEGVAKGEEIFIYNAAGQLLHREVANGESLEIPMTAGQVYIVKIGKNSVKVAPSSSPWGE
ncbi:MAG: GLUG motif-containing protein [Prevotella sp.]